MLALLVSAQDAPAPGPLSPEQWRQDIAFFARELPARHKNLFFHLSKADFDQQIRNLTEAADTASDAQMRAGLERIMALIGDSHSNINAFHPLARFDLRFREFPEGWYCIGARSDMGEAVGARLVSVAGVPIEDLARRLEPFIVAQNPIYTQEMLANMLYLRGALEAAGLPIAGRGADFQFTRDGRQFTIHATVPGRPAAGEWAQRRDIRTTPPGASFPTPLYLSDPNTNYWLRFLDSASTLYVQYNHCVDDKEQPMRKFAEQIARTIGEKHPARIVVDLRGNGGGDSRVSEPLVGVLAKQKRGHVFVAIGRGTGGSGAFAMVDLKNRAHAWIVGEPTLEKPNIYGEQRRFELPNSRLQVTYSTRYYQFVKSGDPQWWEPDQRIDLKASDFLTGRDPVLEWIERQQPAER